MKDKHHSQFLESCIPLALNSYKNVKHFKRPLKGVVDYINLIPARGLGGQEKIKNVQS